jgi:hypothetical protein
LASQIGAGPMSDVQATGDGFKAGQFHNLGPLEGGKAAGARRGVKPRRTISRPRPVRTAGKCARWYSGHSHCVPRRPGPAFPGPSRSRPAHVGLGRTADAYSAPPAAAAEDHIR